MFYLRFKIHSPIRRSSSDWHSYWDKEFQLSKNKSLVLQFIDGELFDIEISWDLKGNDHAGFSLTLGLFGKEFLFQIYDHRHWNYDKDQWEEY